MVVPQLLNDIVNTLLLLAPSAAFLCLVLAGISLRREGGGTSFVIGGGLTKWMFWAVMFLTLQPLLSWFSSFGVSVPARGAAPATALKPPSLAPPGMAAPEALLNSRPIRTEGLKTPKNRVVVLLKDTFQGEANELFIRYAVRNGTGEAYTLSTPQVVAINVYDSSHAVDRLSNSQLTESAAARIKVSEERPVDVVSAKLRSARIDPGQETVGVVSVKLPVRENGPTVLRLVFPGDGKGQPIATLVL